MNSHIKPTARITYLDREWDVHRYQWPSGSALLLLRNPVTGGVLPASLEVSRLPGSPNEAHVPDADGLVKILEDAGIIRPTEVSGRWMGMSMRKCEVIHPELVRSHVPQVSRERHVGREM